MSVKTEQLRIYLKINLFHLNAFIRVRCGTMTNTVHKTIESFLDDSLAKVEIINL